MLISFFLSPHLPQDFTVFLSFSYFIFFLSFRRIVTYNINSTRSNPVHFMNKNGKKTEKRTKHTQTVSGKQFNDNAYMNIIW